MSIQNIDFAKKFKTETTQKPVQKKDVYAKKYKLHFVFFLLGFVLGTLITYQIMKFKEIEKNLIINPDRFEEGPGATNITTKKKISSNVVVSNVPQRNADVMVFLGIYPAKQSSEIIRYLQDKQVLANANIVPCSKLENYPLFKQGAIFRIPVKNGEHQKLAIGCFYSHDEALELLKSLKKINPTLFAESEIIQIED
ncbi:MAG: hypothetical protein NZ853_01585 [Leptospiraceae bacterium]|nr:hypothetical protein [Leptospiraceae bacterium]MDW7976080.1 hypothetical protein [Leptospiraceae bacterium]